MSGPRPWPPLRWLLSRVLPPGLTRDGLVGDLDELYRERRHGSGRVRADAWYLAQVATAAYRYLPRRLGFGGRAAPRARRSRLGAWLGDLRQDARFGAHTLIRRPLLAVVAVVTVALGVGATTVVVSVVNALLVRPMPVADPGSLYVVNEDRSGQTSSPLGVEAVPYERYVAYRAALGEVFATMGAERFDSYALSTGDGASAEWGYEVSGDYFQTLDLVPAAGRFITDDDEPSVVLGYGLWRARFGGDPAAVGRTVRIDSRPYTVIGVAPAGFRGTTHGLGGDLWLPIGAHGGEGWVTFFGRLRPGVEPVRAREVADAVARGIPPLQPQSRVRGAALEPLTGLPELVRPYVERFLALLGGMAVLVLLIAGANIAGILLARGARRRREMAVRVSVGAGRGRLLRQLLTESVLLFLVGGAAGVLLAVLATHLLQGISPPVGFDLALDLHPDLSVLALALLVAGATGIVFGLAPAFQASGEDPVRGLKDLTGEAARGRRGRSWFVGGQVALSALLLVMAGLFVRSLYEATRVELGFDPRGVVISAIDLGPHGYDEARGRAFQTALLERLRAVPGVTAVGMATAVPLFPIAGRMTSDARTAEDPPGTRRANVAYSTVDSGYFDAAGVRVLAGRGFTAQDEEGAPAVTVVNRTLADRFWPGQNPLGRRLHLLGRDFEVIGVTAPGKYLYLNEAPSPWAWLSLRQRYSSSVTLHVRSRLGPAAALLAVREAVEALDPDVAPRTQMPLASAIDITLFPQQLAAVLVGLFGLVGAVLAAVGVYGILAHEVARRTHELGIRLVLGARPDALRRQVVGRGLRVVGLAVVTGLGLAAVSSRAVQGLMIGVSRWDPLTYAGVATLLVGVAVLASWVPARRATRVDPSEALRAE